MKRCNVAHEDPFVEVALKAAESILGGNLSIRRSAPILYKVTVDNRLELTVDQKKPRRGQSAFQTDLCVFEKVDEETEIPRVVIEFKPGITTHDVLTYSTKAGKHKQVYPYLRYGLLIAKLDTIPSRVFNHNDFLDFVVCTGGIEANRLHQLFENLLRKEIEASRNLEEIHFGKVSAYIYRRGVEIGTDKGKVF